MNLLIGIDIGTTNSKVGVFTAEGEAVRTVSKPTETLRDRQLGYSYYDPKRMWESIRSALAEALTGLEEHDIAGVGITSMAESGLLVDRRSGKPVSPFLPWFDTCSEPQAGLMKRESDPFERFVRSGLHGSFKLGLAKLLWLKEHYPESFTAEAGEPVWLSASGWIAYCLTGSFAFDYTLAARTYAFRIDNKAWDKEWIRHFGLSASLFPEAYPSGAIVGRVRKEAETTGLKAGTPVGIAGHDHVASALAVGAVAPGVVYDSMGTAETMVGTLEPKTLTREDWESGISFGLHIAERRYFWMGGQSASGGSVEWLRGVLGEQELSYADILALLEETAAQPTGMLYFPYLTGSGAPRHDSKVKASLIGLAKEHGRGDIIKAVLEGTAYQLEFIKRSAERLSGQRIERLLVVGGGTRNPHWLTVKADITGCTLELPGIPEASLLGAAMAAGIGAGVYTSAEDAYAAVKGRRDNSASVAPDAARHEAYRALYERGFEPLQEPLRRFFADRG
ncbi:FGGY-family carbohydrate kinase [Paenibacillus thermotolerans]|uniref:FGGY-family carbohydrate kinase n=1 Tax=Paenibacillus thermotolerans TaxID=3027807 RepID=UPI0023678D3E|nr:MULTISPECIES: FGGY family carbohydrate kinase [unclassified Paenibacillus]